MSYISKGEWFVRGAICELIDDYRPLIDGGLFVGPYQNEDGMVSQDEEVCSFAEFMHIEGVSTEGAAWAAEGVT